MQLNDELGSIETAQLSAKSIRQTRFRPRYALANLGHPSRGPGFVEAKERRVVEGPAVSFLTRRPLLTLALLTPVVLLVHGYHPLADDGAVYVTGIKKLADPGLYQTDAVFALSPTRLSIFAHVLAALLRWGHISLPVLLLACHAASIFLFLLGSWKVAARIFPGQPARWGAVLLAACCFTLPVAGTSLSIMDPYVTARSFSTPLMLFALAAVLDQQWIACALWLALAALLHPLMAMLCSHRPANARAYQAQDVALPWPACRTRMAAVRRHFHGHAPRGPQPCLQPGGPQPVVFLPLQLAMV